MSKISDKINIELDLEADKAISKLEKIKQLLTDIKKLDNSFSLSNVLEINNDSVLVFNLPGLYKEEYIKRLEKKLEDKINCKCLILNHISLEKVINKNIFNSNTNEIKNIGIDYADEKDYTTETYYIDNKVYKEVTTQYK